MIGNNGGDFQLSKSQSLKVCNITAMLYYPIMFCITLAHGICELVPDIIRTEKREH